MENLKDRFQEISRTLNEIKNEDFELRYKLTEAENKIKILEEAIFQLKNGTEPKSDIRLPISTFIKYREKHLSMDFDTDECHIYGHDVTVHWDGFYCNCGDGAVAENNIISGLSDVLEENGEWG